jgi:hypothetical protein
MTAPARTVRQSLFPEIVAEQPVGRILQSHFSGSNADLVAAVAPFYIHGSVMDCTYGEGAWWTRVHPDQFVAHDLKTDGVDFTALPEPDSTYDTVIFDPPYIPQGGVKHKTQSDFKSRFGLVSRSEAQLWGLIGAGFTECERVLRPGGYLLMKCTDYVNGSAITFGHIKAITLGESLGLRCHDLIVHVGRPGPGGHNIFTPKRARRAHSYLLVFLKPSRTPRKEYA